MAEASGKPVVGGGARQGEILTLAILNSSPFTTRIVTSTILHITTSRSILVKDVRACGRFVGDTSLPVANMVGLAVRRQWSCRRSKVGGWDGGSCATHFGSSVHTPVIHQSRAIARPSILRSLRFHFDNLFECIKGFRHFFHIPPYRTVMEGTATSQDNPADVPPPRPLRRRLLSRPALRLAFATLRDFET